ncbi:hypothetical protein, partial [Sphingomonas bacterium]|uniref:hypothetical protein n=1 Tax=Sphingomonas bacterium TaxID=1895847 RepID=UPI001C2DCCD1
MVTTANIGMNLAGVNYYQTEFPFIDRMKTASSWMGADNIKLDANGYPLAIPAGVDTVYTMVGMDPLSAGLNNTYVLTYTGTATFELLG